MQREVEKFTSVSQDPDAQTYEGTVWKVEKHPYLWRWMICHATGVPGLLASGEARSKPEAMRNFDLAFFGFSMTGRKEPVKATAADFAVEKYEKYNHE
jgi:hypothetical protein